MPFNPGFSISGAGNQNITGSYTEGARLGVVAGCNPYAGSSNPFDRLNPACFVAPMPGSLGVETGNFPLYYPDLINFDMALEKDFAVKENPTNANGIVTGSPPLQRERFRPTLPAVC